MAYNYEYPYTDVYRFNSDWLINRVKELSEKYDNIESIVREIVNEAFAPLEASLKKFVVDSVDEVNEKFIALSREVDRKVLELKQDYYNLLTKEQTDIARLEASINRNYNALYDLIQSIDVDSKERDDSLLRYIDEQIEKIREDFSKEIPAINPITGAVTTLQGALNSTAHALRYGALNCNEYNERGWTAEEYDTLSLSAIVYDLYSKFKFEFFNPFLGKWDDVKSWLTSLTDLNKEQSLTASQYDSLQLTATAYADYNITAFDYDFYGAYLLTQ